MAGVKKRGSWQKLELHMQNMSFRSVLGASQYNSADEDVI